MAKDNKLVEPLHDVTFDELIEVIARPKIPKVPLPLAEYGSEDAPITLGGVELQCFVLSDERRVLVSSHMQKGMGFAAGGSMEKGLNRLQLFASRKGINPFISNDLKDRIDNPILFKLPSSSGGVHAQGYEATVLADLCDAVLEARAAGVLQKQQMGIANQCEILMRGFARVGIVALVDEATGFQQVREKQALQTILDQYLTDYKQKWSKTFPDDFWYKLIKIKGKDSYYAMNRPQYVGHWVNDIIYSRLAPGIKSKLNELNPRLPSGRRGAVNTQYLTDDYGLPELKSHLEKVMTLMDAANNEADFKRLLDKALPKFGDTIELPLEDQPNAA